MAIMVATRNHISLEIVYKPYIQDDCSIGEGEGLQYLTRRLKGDVRSSQNSQRSFSHAANRESLLSRQQSSNPPSMSKQGIKAQQKTRTLKFQIQQKVHGDDLGTTRLQRPRADRLHRNRRPTPTPPNDSSQGSGDQQKEAQRTCSIDIKRIMPKCNTRRAVIVPMLRLHLTWDFYHA